MKLLKYRKRKQRGCENKITNKLSTKKPNIALKLYVVFVLFVFVLKFTHSHTQYNKNKPFKGRMLKKKMLIMENNIS